jgi:NAD(P)H-flavin reductase
MFRVVSKQNITEEIFTIEIEIPEVAAEARAGHHVDVRINPDGPALTLPVAGFNGETGTITVVHKSHDLPSLQLSMLAVGDEVFQVRGPLGAACEFTDMGKVVLAAEDLGVASLYLRVKEYKKRGAYTICLLGFDSRESMFWEEEFAAICDELYVCTRDGGYGVSGRITNPLRAVCETHRDIERIVMIGQLDRMKKVAKLAGDYDIPTAMSFDAIRQPVGAPNVFDVPDDSQEVFGFAKAPEVDANDIDFEKLLARQRALQKETEQKATGP